MWYINVNMVHMTLPNLNIFLICRSANCQHFIILAGLVDHMTPCIVRHSLQMRKTPWKAFNMEKEEETSVRATEEGSLFQDWPTYQPQTCQWSYAFQVWCCSHSSTCPKSFKEQERSEVELERGGGVHVPFVTKSDLFWVVLRKLVSMHKRYMTLTFTWRIYVMWHDAECS